MLFEFFRTQSQLLKDFLSDIKMLLPKTVEFDLAIS